MRTGVDVTLLPRPVVREVQPTNVPEGGGALVEVSGEGFPEFDFVRCKIGSVLGSHARWSSAFSLQCATIAATPGEARLSVAMSGQLQSDGSQYMKYFPMGEVLAIAPQEGLAEQGISVILSGALLPNHPVRVTVGEHTTTAKIGKQGTLTYRTTSTKPGFHQIQMQGTRTEGIQFQYREQPIIKHASTKTTWAGLRTLFHVAGSNLQASCSVGWESASAAAPAHLVSTALAVCEAAWSEEGPATLRVGGSSEGAGVSFAREAHVAGVAPAVSPEAGGAVLSVAGGEFEDSLRCSLGNVAPVGSRWLSAAALECVSVAMRPGAVQAVAPESAAAAGGTVLRLTGRDLPSEGAKCVVGGSSSEAWEAAPGELVCAAPAGAPGFAAVSLDGWTDGQAVFQYREPSVVRSVAQRAGWVGEGTVFHVAGSNLQASRSVEREPAPST